jgi:GPH family glycoside/pentoside/hexuronide:cation symporter
MPLRARLLYASSSFGGEALTQSRGALLVYFYSEASGVLSAFTVGVILAVARLLETVDDGLVGYWSDRTTSRLGRRAPFIILATPFWALFSFLLFTPPESSAAAAGAYLFVVIELYFLASTLSGGPYEALLPEIAPGSDERVSVVGLRVYLGAGGAALGLVGGFLLVDAVGYAGMAAALALVALTFRYVGLAGAWPYASRTVEPAEIGLREALSTTFRNRYFLRFLPAFALFQLGFQMLLAVLPFLIEASLEIDEIGRWGAALTAVALGTMVATIPVMGRLARRTSKRAAYRRALLAAVVVFPTLAFAGFLPGIPPEVQLVVAMVVVGLPIAGNYLFPAPLTADIIDYDSLDTGLRREATYYGAQNFVEKTTSALSPLLVGTLLLLGSTSDDPLGIRLVGPVAALLVLVAWLAFRRYDLPDDVLADPGLVARARTAAAPGPSAPA